jgi:NADH:ubiquinone oxidoreductase subunit E
MKERTELRKKFELPELQESSAKIDHVIDQWRGEPGGLIPILQECQKLLGYLPSELLHHISEELKISYSEIAGVVSFYSFFSTHPRGQFMVRVCMGTACYVRGGQQVLEAFEHELGISVGQTTEDRMFSLEVGRCFGACGLAPVVMVNDEVFQRVRSNTVASLLETIREKAEGGAQ